MTDAFLNRRDLLRTTAIGGVAAGFGGGATLGFGVGFMGHSHPIVKPALARQLEAGWEVGPQTPLAARVAAKLCQTVGHERATFCNTGSEAVMAALRCALGYII